MSGRRRARVRIPVVSALALLVVAVVLPACGRRDSNSTTVGAGTGATVQIGALYPAGGSQGPQGTQERRGVELAAEYANEHGGINGKRVELVNVDADRAEAVPSAMEALHRRHVDIVVGSHGSAISAVAADVATEQHMLFWETGAVGQTDGGVTGGTNFVRMAPMGANLGKAAIVFVRDQLGPRLAGAPALRYGVAYVDDPYGRAVGLGALDEIKASGQTLAGTFPYNASTADFAAIAQQIKAAGVNVLFVSAYLDDGVALRKATIDAHVPLAASIGTSSSYCLPQFGARLGGGADGLYASDKPDAADVRPEALLPEGRAALAWVQDRYQQRYHEPMGAPALSGFSNASALFGHVLPSAGRADPAVVSRVALSMKLPEGALANGGGMDIAPVGAPDAGNNRNAASVIWEWLPAGKRAVVWPPAFANAAVQPIRPAQ